MLKTVHVLCTRSRTAYRFLPGVEFYDRRRDARTFPGGAPVVAHPPCRAWSAFCRHQAKPLPGEKELGLWCVEQVRKNGGVLEQPAHSLLWEAARLPVPGKSLPATWPAWDWAIEVSQSWWGYPLLKRTWLWFHGVSPKEVEFPFSLHAPGGDKEAWSRHVPGFGRDLTTFDFARWLVDQARLSTIH